LFQDWTFPDALGEENGSIAVADHLGQLEKKSPVGVNDENERSEFSLLWTLKNDDVPVG
jgi:hypothetical protein